MCGIIGILDRDGHAAELAFEGLHYLQHRGQETAGICSTDGERLHLVTGPGRVTNVFNPDVLAGLEGFAAIGHTRYSTAGGPGRENSQPLLADTKFGRVAVVHNGNLTNEHANRRDLVRKGAIFSSTSDTEIILHRLAHSRAETMCGAIEDALRQVEGAYSLVFLLNDRIIAVRDPNGFRPLVVGQKDGLTVVASETVALDLLRVDSRYEVGPGAMFTAFREGAFSIRQIQEPARQYQCSFEHVYFARPDSMVYGRYVNESRTIMGQILAREHPADADIVVPVPDSGNFAAQGYAEEARLPYRMGLTRNHNSDRSFILPSQASRDSTVRRKLNPVRNILDGKRIVLVDDSIVRGTTIRRIIRMVRQAGAAKVHVRVSSPPIIGSCYYGLDTKRTADLIAHTKSTDEIASYIEADSLGYLSLEGLRTAVEDKSNFCYSCFTGDYPLEDDAKLLQIERRHKVTA